MNAFTFTAAAATGSAAVGAVTGAVTPWYRLYERTNASSFHLTGTFVASIKPEYSNSQAFDKGTDYTPDDSTFASPTVYALPLGIGDFVRFRCTAFTSGSPKVSLSRALGADGTPMSISEDTVKTPAPSSAGS